MVLAKTQVQRYVITYRPQTDIKMWSETKVTDWTAKIFMPSGNVQQQKVSKEVPEHGENNRMAITGREKSTP